MMVIVDRQKKFMEKEDEDNIVGVMDQNNSEIKNKIQEKQEDVFDAHKLTQNILEGMQSKNQRDFNLIDFGEEQDILEPPKQEITQEQKTIEEASNRKNRKRGKRQKKQINSDDENIEPELEETKEETRVEKTKIEERKAKETRIEKDKPLPKQQINRNQVESKAEGSTLNRQQSLDNNPSSEQQNEQDKINQMVNKKQNNNIDSYVMMHAIMAKAGINKEERRMAILTPLQLNKQSFVYFKRYQSGFSQYFQVIGQDQRPILFCQNQRGCIGCNYYISMTKEMDKNNQAYLGKLRGNAAGSVYQLFDHGIQPNGKTLNRSEFRVNMAYIQYQSNFLGMNGPRKLKAIIPKVQYFQDFDMFKFCQEESLLALEKSSSVITMRNKQPKWNERLKSYALNFGGRVKQASIKNFILMDTKFDENSEEKAPNLITFGKIDQNTFALEFRHPLSLFQAFGIVMSQFDFKLKCE